MPMGRMDGRQHGAGALHIHTHGNEGERSHFIFEIGDVPALVEDRLLHFDQRRNGRQLHFLRGGEVAVECTVVLDLGFHVQAGELEAERSTDTVWEKIMSTVVQTTMNY